MLALGCSGGQGSSYPYIPCPDSEEFQWYCFRSPPLEDGGVCADGEVVINCQEGSDTDAGAFMVPDRCAPADVIADICGESIPCSVGSTGTIYMVCGIHYSRGY